LLFGIVLETESPLRFCDIRSFARLSQGMTRNLRVEVEGGSDPRDDRFCGHERTAKALLAKNVLIMIDR